MIPNHLALVPQYPEQQAAAEAILYVEKKRAVTPDWKRWSYPYAQAFLRMLTGSSKISGKALNAVRGMNWCREDKIPLSSYERALDTFIETQGQFCPLPLPSDLARYVFPYVVFSRTDRQKKRWKRESHQYSRQENLRRQEEERRYHNLVGQAEIDLAFQTPDTLRAWYLRWSQHDISGYDMQRILWAWLERCPSLSRIERWYYSGEPAWVLEADIRDIASASTPEERELERWMVPNKIALREVWP